MKKKPKPEPEWMRKAREFWRPPSPCEILRERIAAKGFPAPRFKDFLGKMRDHVRPAFEARCGAFTSRSRKPLSGVAPWYPNGRPSPPPLVGPPFNFIGDEPEALALPVRFDHEESFGKTAEAIGTIFPPGDQANALLNLVEGAKEKQKEHIADYFNKGKFYDKWFEYLFSIEGEEWLRVFEASPAGRAGVEKRLPGWDGHAYLRIPDAVMLKITSDLFDKINVPRDDSTLRQYLADWKRRAAAGG
jgi:hypothetical protein